MKNANEQGKSRSSLIEEDIAYFIKEECTLFYWYDNQNMIHYHNWSVIERVLFPGKVSVCSSFKNKTREKIAAYYVNALTHVNTLSNREDA